MVVAGCWVERVEEGTGDLISDGGGSWLKFYRVGIDKETTFGWQKWVSEDSSTSTIIIIHKHTHTHTQLTHRLTQRCREREKAQQSPRQTRATDEWRKAAKEWGEKNNNKSALLRLLIKKGLVQTCDTWEEESWREMNVLKDGRWLSWGRRVDSKVWGWCQNGEIFNTDGALKTTTTVIYLKARDKETGLDYMHVFVLFFVFVQARDWYEMNSRSGEGAETERFWRPRVWFKTLPTQKRTLESQPRRKDESPSIKASRLWREWRIVVWRWEAASSKQMADVLIQSPLWWGRWFMGELVVRQDTKWPNSLCARLCTEDKNQHFLPCRGGFFCEYLCDNFFPPPYLYGGQKYYKRHPASRSSPLFHAAAAEMNTTDLWQQDAAAQILMWRETKGKDILFITHAFLMDQYQMIFFIIIIVLIIIIIGPKLVVSEGIVQQKLSRKN